MSLPEVRVRVQEYERASEKKSRHKAEKDETMTRQTRQARTTNSAATRMILKRKRGNDIISNTCNKNKNESSTNEVSLDDLVNPNFEELSRQFPEFGRSYRDVQKTQKQRNGCGNGGGQFSNCITQDFSIALTKALLHVHWGLSLTHLPSHHLCPPIPNRYFYVKWIQTELLPLLFYDCCSQPATSIQSSPLSSPFTNKTNDYFCRQRSLQRVGLDIGTGATCIYPLLFVASSPTITSTKNTNTFQNNSNNSSKEQQKEGYWTLYGSDIDSNSIELARQNVVSNHLQQQIHPILVNPSDCQEKFRNYETLSSQVERGNDSPEIGPLLRTLQQVSLSTTSSSNQSDAAANTIDFCMTNPPFYDDMVSNERTDNRQGDGRARTAMTVSEGSYPGGEVSFILDILIDGLVIFSFGDQQQSVSTISVPPGWSSCMCGKKTSWIKLKHIVTQLLGPAHVRSTEFGPGHLTRWFLAWTFEQPQMRSPLAPTEQWSFVVPLGTMCDSLSLDNEVKEVARRVDEYCRTLPKWNLIAIPSFSTNENNCCIKILESRPAIDFVDDQLLPQRLKKLLSKIDPSRRIKLLPPEGHFVLDVSLQPSHEQDNKTNVIVCNIIAYHHSSHGKKAIEKIKSQLQGEICRTNRRWRRKLERETSQDMDIS